jgi:ketosteroid isomerase-like protein
MRPWIVFCLAGCLCLLALARPSAARISTNANPANMTEDDFRKLEQNWLDAAATPDLPALRKMLSDDFMGTALSGTIVLSKSDIVSDSGTGNHLAKSTLHESTVHIFGDTAVLMGEVEMQMPQKAQEVRMTAVFQKHDEAWQVIALHMSKVE